MFIANSRNALYIYKKEIVYMGGKVLSLKLQLIYKVSYVSHQKNGNREELRIILYETYQQPGWKIGNDALSSI